MVKLSSFLTNMIRTGLVTFLLFWFQCRYYQAFIVYAGCNVILAAAAAAICAYIAPAAAGSGIPEVKAYLNGVDAHSTLAPSTLFVKVRLRFKFYLCMVKRN